ncbi:MAG: hypothetical protein SWO11_17610 [Thermodesulfobacteriota bacterium]|nr:hypothetical protein [Thermodesulfobacteriota bacterium]
MKADVPDVGQTALDFDVLTAEGKTFQLEKALKPGMNIMLIFYRGNW